MADNLNIHKNEAARRWLGRHPRVRFHYTLTHASWVNLIECFFSILLSKQGLAHSVRHSKQDLKDLLHRFLASYNAKCSPFTWTKGRNSCSGSLKPPNNIRRPILARLVGRGAKRRKNDSIKN